jgi:glycosyltransferase involved in cell wall biosynthesis
MLYTSRCGRADGVGMAGGRNSSQMSTPRKPRVSVIVPAYNAAATIEACVAGIAGQSFDDWELIVADDASTDDTGARAVATHPGCRVVRADRNGGPAAARNLGISIASGELLAFLDADDEWLPRYLESQVAAFDRACERGIHAGVVACDAYKALVVYRLTTNSVSSNRARMAGSAQTTYRRALERGRLTPRQTLKARRALAVNIAIERLERLGRRPSPRGAVQALQSLIVIAVFVLTSPNQWTKWRHMARHRALRLWRGGIR